MTITFLRRAGIAGIALVFLIAPMACVGPQDLRARQALPAQGADHLTFGSAPPRITVTAAALHRAMYISLMVVRLLPTLR